MPELVQVQTWTGSGFWPCTGSGIDPELIQVMTLNCRGSGSGNVPESSSEEFWDELVQAIYLNFQVIYLK